MFELMSEIEKINEKTFDCLTCSLVMVFLGMCLFPFFIVFLATSFFLPPLAALLGCLLCLACLLEGIDLVPSYDKSEYFHRYCTSNIYRFFLNKKLQNFILTNEDILKKLKEIENNMVLSPEQKLLIKFYDIVTNEHTCFDDQIYLLKQMCLYWICFESCNSAINSEERRINIAKCQEENEVFIDKPWHTGNDLAPLILDIVEKDYY
jgi:hypothetical protein